MDSVLANDEIPRSQTSKQHLSAASNRPTAPIPHISVTLALSCDVGKELIKLTHQDENSANQGTQALDPSTMLPLPHLPDSVPLEGLTALDAFVQTVNKIKQNGSAANDEARNWAASFLASNIGRLRDLACAADYLGCGSFLQLVIELQLLRVTLMKDQELWKFVEGETEALMPLADLQQSDLAKLPCLEPPPHDTLPLRQLAVKLVEKLVGFLDGHNCLEFVRLPSTAIRSTLYRLGVRPVLTARRSDEVRVSDAKKVYLQLELPVTGDVGAALFKHHYYQVGAVKVVVESHDQGWNSYPSDHNTTRNSWTWGEVHILRACGANLRPQVEAVYTNLHAVSDWQVHREELGPESPLVMDINSLVLRRPGGAAGEATSATGTRVVQITHAAGQGDDVSGSSSVPPGQQEGPAKDAAEGREVYSVALLLCAAFPGWQNFTRRAEIIVELKPI